MKKIGMAVLVVALLAGGTSAYAVDRSDPRYQEIKELKDKQRAEREANKKNPPAENKNSFWHKEGERSGLGGSGNKVGSFIKNLNPAPFFKKQQEKYNDRKLAATK